MSDRASRHDQLRGGHDGVAVDAVVAIEIGDRAGLPEMLDPQRAHAVAGNAAEPRQSGGMRIHNGDEAAMGGKLAQQPLDVGARMDEAAFTRPLGGHPTGVEPVGRSDGQKPDVAAILGHEPDGMDRLGGDGARISDDDLTVWTRSPHR